MTKTTKEKKFTTKDAEKLYKFKQDKSVAVKGYETMNAFAKENLKPEKMYVYNTKEFGKLSMYISKSERDAFAEKAFAEAHPKLFKKFVKAQKRIALSIKPVKK